MPRVARPSSTRGLVLLASGSCVARPSAPASRKPATNFSPLPLFRFRNGRRCAPPTPWSESTRNFGGGPRPRLRSPARRRFCSCFSASCAVKTLKRRLQDCDAALASDDGPIFSTVAKLVEALKRSIPEGTQNAELKKEALRLGRELLQGTKYEET